ncbi:MAG: alanine--tRNA ligase [Odoribacter sp.]|nr:alanine--tRNA ligase [Odoribacter sp.]
MKAKELRQKFFDFFRSKNHEIVPSAPMVIKNDPTLMFTNAGMNQFKDIFLGNQPANINRIANSQKCLRVSGKHNDLEEVGHDTYHHTMFEMLGNWSFGDYFKKEAIEWGWEFLTKVLDIPEDRLYATIFEGSSEDDLSKDIEAEEHWKNCFSDSENRILNGSKKDNFWEMGETGPCGPCSEIHVDIRNDDERKRTPGHLLVNKGHPQVIEIWNLVFIQYNRKANGELEQLPSRHVDTGMGFERLCMVVQGKKSNYDTDIFQSVIEKISDLTGRKYGVKDSWDTAMRVIADHLRAVAFSIADGQNPSNNKAGYVIRRILRRASRYGYNNLGMEEPFIYKLVPVLSGIMEDHYPELKSGKDHIGKVIREEEISFLKTLGKGLKMIEKMINENRKSRIKIFSGKVAFELYDTFGFPVDLTQLILREHGMTLDIEGFENEMEGQKERSREDASVEAGDWHIVRDIDGTEFTGYDKTEESVEITRYRRVKVKGKDSYQIVFSRTPFYPESGGQIGDTGVIAAGNDIISVNDTIKENNLIIHVASKLPSDPYSQFKATVDQDKRKMTANNHTATHLIHFALRTVLGTHVEQKGSLVTSEKLRFDFSHFSRMTKDELMKVEEAANRMVRENYQVNIIEGVTPEDAEKMGAMALFGEKYGDKVRVVGFGRSIELCGGTHVSATGNIGHIKIISEGAIAAGIRRIEAVTACKADEYINIKLNSYEEIESLLPSTGNITENVEKLLAENNSLRKTIEKFRSLAVVSIKKSLEEKAVDLGSFRIITAQVEVDSAEMLKKIAHQIRNTEIDTVMVIGSEIEGKANLLVMVSENLVTKKKINAASIIKEISSDINGGGGGQSFLATAGGKNPAGIPSALLKAAALLKSL